MEHIIAGDEWRCHVSSVAPPANSPCISKLIYDIYPLHATSNKGQNQSISLCSNRQGQNRSFNLASIAIIKRGESCSLAWLGLSPQPLVDLNFPLLRTSQEEKEILSIESQSHVHGYLRRLLSILYVLWLLRDYFTQPIVLHLVPPLNTGFALLDCVGVFLRWLH